MKIVAQTDLNELVAGLKKQGKVIVFTNGCFDILHVGHVRYLQAAKALGDVLILGVNSDLSVEALKGPGRPINNQDDRAEVLSGLEAVDYIVIFDEITAEILIEKVRPDIYVKGGDYDADTLPETEIVRKCGGKLVFIPEVQGRSSTNVIKKIRDRQG